VSHETNSLRRVFGRMPGYTVWMKKIVAPITAFDSSQVARYRLRVVIYYRQFGIKATLAAFPVGRSSIFSWQKKLFANKGSLISLIPQSTKPKRARRMVVHPKAFCHEQGVGEVPSASKLGKIIKRHNLFYQRPTTGAHNPNRKAYTKRKKVRVTKAPRPTQGGYIQADTVETITSGVRRYTISFIDVNLKIAHSKTFTGKLSKYALEAFKEFQILLLTPIHIIQTDNGSEFEGLFDQYLQKQKIKHWWTYPNCPKINGVIERYNRSVQEEWILSYLDEIDDTIQFNKRLKQYLYFYNNQRVHESLQLKTPSQVVGRELKSPRSV